MAAISDSISVTTEPPGAAVYLTRFTADAATAAPRQRLGTSPLTNVRIARGEYVLSIEKDGYAPIERTVSGVTIRASALTITPPPIRIDQRLLPADAPCRRAWCSCRAEITASVAWSRPTDRRVRLDDYFIDKYEVSNQEYKEFINAGGYVKREFWKHPFVKDGRTLSWDEAMRVLVDRTGLPGPRTWSNQSFPEGKADHPVTDITWYEAAAYAGVSRQAAGDDLSMGEGGAERRDRPQAGVAGMPWGAFYPGDPLERSRELRQRSPCPSTSAAFGMSAFGAYNMAGNVAEWTLNDSSDGFLATGGAWGDPTYTFAQFGGRPGFFSSEKLGFRCARLRPTGAGDQGGCGSSWIRKCRRTRAASPQVFAKLATAYRYEKAPLDARIEADDRDAGVEAGADHLHRRQRRARDRVSLSAQPRAAAAPGHAFIPAGDVDGGFRSLPDCDGRPHGAVRQGRARGVWRRARGLHRASEAGRAWRPSRRPHRRVRRDDRQPRHRSASRPRLPRDAGPTSTDARLPRWRRAPARRWA